MIGYKKEHPGEAEAFNTKDGSTSSMIRNIIKRLRKYI